MGRHIKKGDDVCVLSGKYKGSRGKILEVLVSKERVRIEGIATIKKHLKKGKDPKHPDGGIVSALGTIHWSNVLPVDPSTGKPTRVSHKIIDGKKVRVARASQTVLA